jgi:hypothetical protein
MSNGDWIEIDGAQVLLYADASLRIAYQPPIAGSAMPFLLDVWKIGTGRPVKVLACLWGASDAGIEAYCLGIWERALWAALAGRPVRAGPARARRRG